MKELISSIPLMLFLFLLLILSVSIYFGNVKISENLETISDETLAKDIKTIIDYVKTPSQQNSMEGNTDTSSISNNGDDWFQQWDTIANSDYIPKTQIVPLNCPQCQNSKGGVCTGCGGLGGKGTSSNYKNRFADFLSTYGSGYRGNGEWAGFGGCGSRGDDSNSNNPSLSSLAEKAGSGAVDLLRDTGSGAVDLLRDTGSEAVDLLRDTGSETVDLLRDTTSGAVGLVREAGSEVSELLRPNPVQLGRNGGYGANSGEGYANSGSGENGGGYGGYGAQSVKNQGMIDPYSYNGALVSKGSNFIPITDDFSAFRK
jgi:hypothetical protein